MSTKDWVIPGPAPMPITPTTPQLPRAALTLKQAGEYAGVSRSFLYKLFDEGKLPRLKAGKRVLILKADLDAYLIALREAAA